jgi:hypothetical protein
MKSPTALQLVLFFSGCALSCLSGCATYQEVDVTADYVKDAAFQKGYKVGGVYELQTDLFVTKLDRPHYYFTKPGGLNTPTIAAWDSGRRKSNFYMMIGLIRAGAKVRVEKVIFIRSRNGIEQVTCMFRADGFDLLISPFEISDLIHVGGGQTLCLPDPKFLKEAP